LFANPLFYVAYPDTLVLKEIGMKIAPILIFHPKRIVFLTPTPMHNFFAELGNTPDEVAEAIRARNIRGVRNTVRMLNPIVRYAHSWITRPYSIDLLQGDRLHIVYANGEMSEVDVPKPVLEFLAQFHRGQYPDLEVQTGQG
jgi:hypothetical protein